MSLYHDPLPRKTTQRVFDQWISVVKRYECASVVLLPRSDRHYRIAQFLSVIPKKPEDDVRWVAVSFQSFVTERWDEFIKQLDAYRIPDKRTAFLVKDAEWLFSAAPHLIARLQEYVLKPYRQASFIFFFERNIFDPEFSDVVSVCPSLFQNVFVKPLYERDDMLHFTRHLEELYGFTLKTDEREEIWRQTRGYIWLATEAVRSAHEHGRLSFDHPAMQFRLHAVWEGFSRQEQQFLLAVAGKGKASSDLDETRSFLLQTGLITEKGNTYSVTVPILFHYVEQIVHQMHQLTLDHDSLLINHTRVDLLFPEREHALLVYFLKHKGEILLRDTVATILWGENWEEQCSDWALDQAMRRLRNRLEQLGLSKQLIQTVKGKGYQYSGNYDARKS